MKKIIEITYKILLVLIIFIWIGLIYVEYKRYEREEPMVVELKEKVISYDDGYVEINYGLGYKSITYNRTSIQGKEFGHLFIKVRDHK